MNARLCVRNADEWSWGGALTYIQLAVREVRERAEWMGQSHDVTRYVVTLNSIEIARASSKKDALQEAVSKFSSLAKVLESSNSDRVEVG